MRNVRRKQVADNRKKRRLIYLTLGIMLFIYLTMNMIVGENGLMKYIQLRSMKNRLHAETSSMKRQNKDARSQIETLENEPDRVEELAREYGMTKKGELIFKFDDQE